MIIFGKTLNMHTVAIWTDKNGIIYKGLVLVDGKFKDLTDDQIEELNKNGYGNE